MSDFFSQRRALALIILLAFAVFLTSAVFVKNSPLLLSPDETANRLFAQQFAATGQVRIPSPANVEFSDVLVPRSMRALDGVLVPGSFIGLPVVYGAISILAGKSILPFLTPLFAFLGVLAFYGVVRRFFDKEIAFYAALFLAVQPGWWYYSARSFMHNVPFVAFLLFSLYVLVARPIQSSWPNVRGFVDPFLAGILFALALFFRTSEVVWIIGAVVIAGFVYRRKIVWRHVLAFVVGAIIVLGPALLIHVETYGDPITTGYTVGTDSITGGVGQATTDTSLRSRVEGFLAPAFPFGIHPRAAWFHVTRYGFGLFWWMWVPVVIGLGVWYQRRRERLMALYVGELIFIGAWLGLLYGSWVIFDNPDPTAITIGNSYVRYWLPVFVLALPLAGMGIQWMMRRLPSTQARQGFLAFVLAGSLLLSAQQVIRTPGDGLYDAAETLERSEDIQVSVLAQTPEDAIIVADRGDKIFFPHRDVRVPLRNEESYALIPIISNVRPLYYYGLTLPDADLAHLIETRLSPHGLTMELIETFDAETLYRIYGK